MNKELKQIIFFDGKCNLCDRFVNFVFKKDTSRQFFYAPLQGSTAQNLLHQDFKDLKTIIFLKEGKILKGSQALAEIMILIYPKWITVLKILPYSFYNIFYYWLAKRRRLFFGEKKGIFMPLEDQKKYFLS